MKANQCQIKDQHTGMVAAIVSDPFLLEASYVHLVTRICFPEIQEQRLFESEVERIFAFKPKSH
jgi:hypothetical protein